MFGSSGEDRGTTATAATTTACSSSCLLSEQRTGTIQSEVGQNRSLAIGQRELMRQGTGAVWHGRGGRFGARRSWRLARRRIRVGGCRRWRIGRASGGHGGGHGGSSSSCRDLELCQHLGGFGPLRRIREAVLLDRGRSIFAFVMIPAAGPSQRTVALGLGRNHRLHCVIAHSTPATAVHFAGRHQRSRKLFHDAKNVTTKRTTR